MRFLKVSFALSFALAGIAANANANLIVNGGFENPVNSVDFNGGHYSNFGPGFTGWTITHGDVDIVDNHNLAQSYSWAAQTGRQSLDLNGFNAGTIEQSFLTTPGQLYELSYFYANNAYNGGAPTANVTLSGASSNDLLNSSIQHSGSSPSAMNWVPVVFTFVANSSSTTLIFESTIPGSGGIALDSISVNPVPEPSTFALAGLGGLGLAIGAYRRRKAAASV